MLAVIDIGTLLIHSALAGQESRVVVTNKQTRERFEFKNATEFWGHHKKKEGGVLAQMNSERLAEGKPALLPEDFDVETVVSLVENNGKSSEEIACGRLKSKINSIRTQNWCSDFVICYGIGENFRYAEAHTQPYKSSRPDKPILLDKVKEFMLHKYKNNLHIVEGVEDDDIVTQYLWRDWVASGKDHSKLKCVGVYIDKDISQTPCLNYNFDKPELGLVKIGSVEAAKNLAKQLLKGDDCDTIPGLRFLDDCLFKKYGLRKAKSGAIGEKTADGVFKDSENITEIFNRVVEAYRLCYGEEMQEFISFRGEKFERNWLDHLNEQFQLLRMRTNVNKPVGHISDFLNRVGVKL